MPHHRAQRRYSFSTSRSNRSDWSHHNSGGLSALAAVAPLPFENQPVVVAAKKAMVLDPCAVSDLPGSDSHIEMASDCSSIDAHDDQELFWSAPLAFDESIGTESDSVCDDGEDIDEEAYNAVFPQAPELVKQHALRPLTTALRSLLARPSHLVAALLANQSDMEVQGPLLLEQKAHAYMQSQVEDQLRAQDWTCIFDALQRVPGKSRDDRWTDPELVQQVDTMMLKLTLHYVRLWKLVSMIAVTAVHDMETTLAQLRTEYTRSSSTKSGKEDASAHHQDKKRPLDPTAAMFRPLRLRSQTAKLGKNATPPASASSPRGSNSSRTSSELMAPPPPTTSTPGKIASSSTANAVSSPYRSPRLARKSNEFMVAWFLHHKANPYPSSSERLQIADKTGLTEQQVRNWFANMRKRHWKPKATNKKQKKPRCLLDMLLRRNDGVSASTSASATARTAKNE